MRIVYFILTIKVVLLLHTGIAYPVIQNEAIRDLAHLLTLWNRWDAPHYQNIAANGYASDGEWQTLIVFLPFYPWMIRALEPITGSYYYAALLISTIASVISGVLLYRLIRLDFDEPTAQKAALLLLLFPTGYFLHIAYTESLFLALLFGCLYAARTGRWKIAGTLGCLAAMTRITGSILFPVLLYEAWRQWRERGGGRPSECWPIALVPVGLIVFLAVNQAVHGDPFAFMEYQRTNWHRRVVPPWDGLHGAWGVMRGGEPWMRQMIGAQELAFSLLAIIATVASLFWLRGTYTLWMIGNVLLVTSTSYLQSVPRYCLAMFPIMILIARYAQSLLAWTIVVFVSATMMALFSVLFSTGRWAF